jgi:hypothetical protein
VTDFLKINETRSADSVLILRKTPVFMIELGRFLKINA